MRSQDRILADDQIERFNDDGFLAIDQFVPLEEVGQLRAIYDRLFATRAGWEDGRQFDLGGAEDGTEARLPQILEPSRYAPELRTCGFVARARTVAHQLFGADALEEYGEHMIYKPPLSGAATPWHQDEAYHDPALRERSINFWMPLDDTDLENGCIHYARGSHRHDVLPHHSIGNDPRIHGLEVDEPGCYAGTAVACPLPAGGVLLHWPTTIHYAGPNASDRPRRAYILIMRAPPGRRDKPFDNYWMREKRTARSARANGAKS
jgi:hypothetical protein